MQWSNPLHKLFPPKEKAEYFLSLILRDGSIEALVFEKTGANGQIIGKEREIITNSIEELKSEELIEVCDRAISGAEEYLPADKFSSKTVLCLKDTWVIEGKIKKEYLPILKKLKEELELDFIGFIVITEAISSLLTQEEGVPPTAILVGREKDLLTVVLLRSGNIAELVTKSIGADKESQVLLETLRSFKDYEILPSRIILFDSGEELEELRQQLISFPWTKTLPFLHFPKIEIVGADFVQQAVIAGFSTQLGINFDEGLKEVPVETFGFVKEKDVELEKEKKEKEEIPEKMAKKEVKFRLPSLNVLKNIQFPQVPQIPSFSHLRLIPIAIAVGLILTFFVGFYVFIPRAAVTIYVAPKTIELKKELDIKGIPLETEVGDTIETEATGKKEVGEKAKGEVTLYNKVTSSKTFTKGTVLSGNDLKFSLDDEVTIASASDSGTSLTYGIGKAKVTAVAFGEESNLPSGITFSLASFSTSQYSAKNDNAFSGGSKKEVTVVSKKDQDGLAKTLLDKLTQTAKEEINRNNSQNLKILETTLSQEILEKKWSRQIDEEASKFSLTLKVKVKALGLDEKELTSLFETQVEQAAPADFTIKTGGLDFSFGKTKVGKDKNITGEVVVRATLLPKLSVKELKTKLAAKPIEEALKIMANTANVSDYKIRVSPIFPLFPKRMPIRGDNIKIVILENEKD
ncbi:hypothetical protein HYS29_01690 [Candidatus Microgenomates bacterium]|nr:hypothetical protein [Candidatus Microgenomates bacterium]